MRSACLEGSSRSVSGKLSCQCHVGISLGRDRRWRFARVLALPKSLLLEVASSIGSDGGAHGKKRRAITAQACPSNAWGFQGARRRVPRRPLRMDGGSAGDGGGDALLVSIRAGRLAASTSGWPLPRGAARQPWGGIQCPSFGWRSRPTAPLAQVMHPARDMYSSRYLTLRTGPRTYFLRPALLRCTSASSVNSHFSLPLVSLSPSRSILTPLPLQPLPPIRGRAALSAPPPVQSTRFALRPSRPPREARHRRAEEQTKLLGCAFARLSGPASRALPVRETIALSRAPAPNNSNCLPLLAASAGATGCSD